MTITRFNWLDRLFKQNDHVCVGGLYETRVVPVLEALESHGPFISINPLQERRADMNVTAHRNFLVEMDGAADLDSQRDIIYKLSLPFTACTWSGGKSLHFIVALEDPIDATTWRRWARALVEAIPGADRSTVNPSRFTRLPEALRPDKGVNQTLDFLGGNVANKDFEAWITPHLKPELPNFRKIYADLTGATGLDAAHPMTKAFIEGTHPCLTGRNNALFKSAADLRDCGVDVEEAYNLLTPTATTLGLSEKEVANTIRSAYARRR